MNDRLAKPPDKPADEATGAMIRRRGLLTGSALGLATLGAPSLAAAPPAAAAGAGGGQASIELVVNGQLHRLMVDPRRSLLDALREDLALTGTKKGCDHGQCGACTVHVDGRRVLSCLTLAAAVRGPVTTIEGLAAPGGELHPMQQAFIDQDAFQCGYCTPGQIMSAVACVSEGHAGSEAEIREAMSGNLCRCAAYPHIVAAIQQARGALTTGLGELTTMQAFTYLRADDLPTALKFASASGRSAYLAGGTTLVDCLKLDAIHADALIDINGLVGSDRAIGRIEAGPEGLKLGALVRMAELAEDPTVNRDYPLIAQTMKMAASGQLRNMATLGGNVLQKSRCSYFRDTSWSQCNKRAPGSGCAAIEGENRRHAVLGTSGRCISSYPGDFAQALVALDARVQTVGPQGRRQLPFEDLHRGSETPHVETALQPGELITGFIVPAGPWTRRSLYLKVRDRESYEFALASAAVCLDIGEGGRVREARIALGGLAYKPWRARLAETVLKGQRLDERSAAAAGRAAMHGAKTHSGNAFKAELGARTVERALLQAAAMDA